MQVSHVRDHVTHAVIGAQKPIDFGISDSPEFFHILSSTLYSNQKLAVVREVLCNAWDAHIEAGYTDRAVEVTLTETHLTIRDFGSGIHDDAMGPIYGVYGGSTKKANGKVTGGFGLGCKAPFAYGDHFQVTSWHEGRKTIYNLSKSSAEVQGKPSITPIVSIPSDETGLEVKIPIQSADQFEFKRLIQRVALQGEILTNLNGDRLVMLPFSKMTQDFLVCPLSLIGSQIAVRYGNVIYPVENHDAYRAEYENIFNMLRWGMSEEGIVFQAPPHSISVTPSRESLSMQEHTITTLKKLLSDFDKLRASNYAVESLEVARKAVASALTKKEYHAVLNPEPKLVGRFGQDERDKILWNIKDVLQTFVARNYPQDSSFRYKDLLQRVDALIDDKFGNVNLLKSYRSELIRAFRRKRLHDPSDWLQRKVLGPLLYDMKGTGLNPRKLTVYSHHNNQKRWDVPSFVSAQSFQKLSLPNLLPFLRSIIVLTHNQQDVIDRVGNFPEMQSLGNPSDVIVYSVPRNTTKVKEARAFFDKPGVVFIDLTKVHPWEAPDVVEPITQYARAPKRKGLPTLSSLYQSNDIINMNLLEREGKEDCTIKRIEDPEVVVQLPRTSYHYLNGFGVQTNIIAAKWGDKIGIATNATQLHKYLKKGAAELEPWVVEQVVTCLNTDKKLQRALTFKAPDFNSNLLEDVFELVYSDDELKKRFGIRYNLDQHQNDMITLWNSISNWYGVDVKYPSVAALRAKLKEIEPHKNIDKLRKLVLKSELIRIINTITVRRKLQSDELSDDQKKKARSLFIQALTTK